MFGGGGGVIVPSEIRALMDDGVARIDSPVDGQRIGLRDMIGEMIMRCDHDLSVQAPTTLEAIQGHSDAAWRALAQLITALENGKANAALVQALRAQAAQVRVPVLASPAPAVQA